VNVVRAEYEKWHGRLEVDESSDTPWHRLVKEYLRRLDLTGLRILEIGCGRGGFAAWLASRGAGVTGGDFSFTAVSKARTFAREARFEVADIHALPHADSTFDIAVSCETLEHLPAPAAALRELRRVLKPRGGLYLTTPNYFGSMGLYRGYLRLTGRRYTEEGQPINRFMTLPWTIHLARSAGLTVERVDAVGHYLPFPGRPPIELPVLNRARFITRWAGLHSFILARKQ
jgi:2-polyprenyl-3-methyl-5-hydroxy-6-metoxy-1,4-benzoquinol methylase